jgi:hypothetical protein
MVAALLGLAEVDITPTAPVQTIGFGREDELSRGVLQGLSAQVAVWRLSANECCLVAIDHIGFSAPHAERLRREIGTVLGIARERIMLCFSHTHSAPNDSLETAYFESVCSRVTAGVAQAAERMAPVCVAWGNAYADVGVNRRAGCDTVDRRIGVLKVVDAASRELRLLLLRLTAHANVLKGDNYLISPDYFGSVRDRLRERYGCAVMAVQGASGNVAPRYYRSGTTPPDVDDPSLFVQSETALGDMADEVARQLAPVLDGIHPRSVEHLDMYSVRRDFSADVPDHDGAMALAAEAKREAGIDGTAWLAEVERLLSAGIRTQTQSVEMQYFAVNDGCLCGVPNEIMCELALRAGERLHGDVFYLNGYTNGCTGYLPSEEEYDQGGYEVYWSMLTYFIYFGRVSPLRRDSASRLVAAAAENAPPYLRRGCT